MTKQDYAHKPMRPPTVRELVDEFMDWFITYGPLILALGLVLGMLTGCARTKTITISDGDKTCSMVESTELDVDDRLVALAQAGAGAAGIKPLAAPGGARAQQAPVCQGQTCMRLVDGQCDITVEVGR